LLLQFPVASDAREFRVALPSRGSIALPIPDDWGVGLERRKPDDDGRVAAATFFIDSPQDQEFCQANLLAGADVDGQWYDIHVSMGDTQRPDRTTLLRLLHQIEIR
jgi:hypothetical protein